MRLLFLSLNSCPCYVFDGRADIGTNPTVVYPDYMFYTIIPWYDMFSSF